MKLPMRALALITVTTSSLLFCPPKKQRPLRPKPAQQTSQAQASTQPPIAYDMDQHTRYDHSTGHPTITIVPRPPKPTIPSPALQQPQQEVEADQSGTQPDAVQHNLPKFNNTAPTVDGNTVCKPVAARLGTYGFFLTYTHFLGEHGNWRCQKQ